MISTKFPVIDKFDIWLANLNPQRGTETGKVRPVLVIQSDLLNNHAHPSTIILPLTTNIKDGNKFLAVQVEKGVANLDKNSDIMLDQIRAIDNKKLIQKIGELPFELRQSVNDNLIAILDLE